MRRRHLAWIITTALFWVACDEGCDTPLVGGDDAGTSAVDEALWILEQPYPDIANLNGVWGYSHDDVWAVGTGGSILHFDGSSWERVPSPTTADLYALDGHESMTDGDKDIYAVGASGTILHWDGVVWGPEPAISDPRRSDGRDVTDTLMGVWHGGQQGIYVVGENGTVLAKRGDLGDASVPMTWSFMQEELVQNRLPVCETRVAYDGDGYPAAGSGGLCQPCNIAPPRNSDGTVATNDDGSPLAQSMWMCSASASTPVPLCQGPDYNAARCEVPSTQRRGPDPQCSFGQRCQDDGATPMYQVTYFPVDFKAVVGYGSGNDLRVIAVGESGAIVELRPDGSSGASATWNCQGTDPSTAPASCWRPVARAGNSDNPAVRDTLAGVWGTWANNIYAVGEDGRVLWRNGDAEWVRGSDVTQSAGLRLFLSPPTPVFIRDVWHQGRNDFFLIGFSGVVMHHQDGLWTVEEVPTTAHLRALWGKTRDDLDASVRDAAAPRLRTLIAVGAEGTILRRSLSK